MESTISLRSVSAEVRQHIKQQIVRLHKKGMKGKDIAETLNITNNAVSRTVSAYKKEGASCIKEKTRGRRVGMKRLLTQTQEKEIQRIIIDEYPDQMKLSFALWTREAIRQLIKNKYGIDIPVRSVSNYLSRWGMTCQRPTKRAYCQDNIKLKTFMEETYPSIVEIAKKEDCTIYWGDETGINNQEYYMRGFAPKGQTPVLQVVSKREKINMISAITNQGTCRFMCYEESMTQDRFIEFMRRLVRDCDRKVLFIVDNLKVHHGKKVQSWLDRHSNEIELFFTSPYSPEINPDEYLNHNLKQSVHTGVLPRTKEDILKKTHSFMRTLQKNAIKVIQIFKHKNLEYIRQYSY